MDTWHCRTLPPNSARRRIWYNKTAGSAALELNNLGLNQILLAILLLPVVTLLGIAILVCAIRGALVLTLCLSRKELVEDFAAKPSQSATCTRLHKNVRRDLRGDAVKLVLWKDAQQAPSQIQRLKDGALLVGALRDEAALKLVEKLERQLVLCREGLLADDGLHRGGILANGVLCVHLVAHVAVVLARVALANGRLHQPRERGEDVDGRVDAAVVQRAVDKDLALGDVARQVGDGVGNVCRVSVHTLPIR